MLVDLVMIWFYDIAGLIVNITLLGLALFASSLPTNIVFLTQANEADSLSFVIKYLLTSHGSCVYCREEPPCTSAALKRQNIKIKGQKNFRWSVLLFCLLFLLILCGDVELNPGPLSKIPIYVV